jgi:hypothetical protein
MVGEEKPVFHILDGHPIPKFKLIEKFVEDQKEMLKRFYLPPYPPVAGWWIQQRYKQRFPDIMTIAPVNASIHLADALSKMYQGGDEKYRADYDQCKHLWPNHIETGSAIENRLSGGNKVRGGRNLHDVLRKDWHALARRGAA